MSVKIRLARGGRKKLARYRIVAADSRARRDGRFLENLGYYNPQATPKEFKINASRVDYWLTVGAEVSQTVQNLLKEDNFDAKRAALKDGSDVDAVERKAEKAKKPKKNKKKEG